MTDIRGRLRESVDGLRSRRDTEAAQRMRESAQTDLERQVAQKQRRQELALDRRPSGERPNNPETTDGGW